MKSKSLMAFILLSLVTVASFGAPKKAAKTTATRSVKSNSQAQLGTSFKFDGTALRGKYQSSLGTAATVENDKYMDDLLGGRKKFNDRIRDEKQRN